MAHKIDAKGYYGVKVFISRWEEWKPTYHKRCWTVAEEILSFLSENNLFVKGHRGPSNYITYTEEPFWLSFEREKPEIFYNQDFVAKHYDDEQETIIKYIIVCLDRNATFWFEQPEDRNSFMVLFNSADIVKMEAVSYVENAHI